MKSWHVLALFFGLYLPLSVVLMVRLLFFKPDAEEGAAAGLRVAVVDLTTVIAEMSRHRAAYANPEQGIADAAEVRGILRQMAREDGLLLLAPGAALAGAEDMTAELRRRLRHAGLLPALAADSAGKADATQ